MRTREKKVENLEKENQKLKSNLSSANVELSNKTKEHKKLTDKMEATQKDHEKVCAIYLFLKPYFIDDCTQLVSSLREEVQSLQAKLKEIQSLSQQESGRLEEATKAQRKLEEMNAVLTSQLTAAQVKLTLLIVANTPFLTLLSL